MKEIKCDKVDQMLPAPFVKHVLAPQNEFGIQKKYLVNLQKFWDLGRPPPPVGKNSQIISFFLYENVPKSHIADWELSMKRKTFKKSEVITCSAAAADHQQAPAGSRDIPGSRD